MIPSKTTIKRLVTAGVTLAGVALGTAQEGCSFVTNETAIQCVSQEDCQRRGAGFENSTCDEKTKTCTQVESPVECTKNSECAEKTPGTICRKTDRKCVQVTTTECPVVLGSPDLLLNDDALILGLITPAGSAELGDAFERAAELAQSEIAPSSTGTGIPTANGQTRPVVIVSCREFNPDGFQGLLRGAEHLVKDLQVPVVIGPADPTNASQVARNVTLPNSVLQIASTSITSALKDLPNPIDKPLVWRLNWGDTEALNVVQKFLDTQLVPKLKADGILGATEPLRIAIVAEGDYKGTQFARLLRDNLTWNTKPDGSPAKCIDNLGLVPQACVPLEFGDLNDTIGNPSPEQKIATVLGGVFQTFGAGVSPHVVLHSYAVFGIPRVLFPMEGAWDAAATGHPRPYHIGLFPPFNAFQPLYQNFMPAQEKAPHPPSYKPISQRIFALYPRPTADQADVDAFVLSYKLKFPDFQNSATPGDILTRLFYDSVYMAVYAAAANGDRPITGPNLAEALPRLRSGQPVKVGSTDLQIAYKTLSVAGQSINVQGVSGSIDLDPVTGAPKYSMEISCPGIIPGVTQPANIGKGGPYNQFVGSGFYFDETAGTALGDMPGNCPTLTQGTTPDLWP